MAKKAKSTKGSSYSDREVLEIFVESVDELLNSDFASEIKAGVRVGLLTGKDGDIVTKCKGPRRDAIKAFLLTLRFFCQDNEPTSLRQMAHRISGLPVEAELKKLFLESRRNFNTSLDSAPYVPIHGVGADTN